MCASSSLINEVLREEKLCVVLYCTPSYPGLTDLPPAATALPRQALGVHPKDESMPPPPLDCARSTGYSHQNPHRCKHQQCTQHFAGTTEVKTHVGVRVNFLKLFLVTPCCDLERRGS